MDELTITEMRKGMASVRVCGEMRAAWIDTDEEGLCIECGRPTLGRAVYSSQARQTVPVHLACLIDEISCRDQQRNVA